MGVNKHVVMLSGGIGSWAAGKRVVERHGVQDVTLLFTDVMMEDRDLYRFLIEGACTLFGQSPPIQVLQWWQSVPEFHEDAEAFQRALEVLRADMAEILPPLTWIADGRDPWQVFIDERFLGGTRGDPCSKILKRKMADRWLAENMNPANTIVHVGIDWSESHRYTRLRDRRAETGWRYEAPMCDAPYMWKPDMLRWLKEEGIRPPRLYDLGFTHNNCGGFCVKAGIGHFANLLRTLPERYAFHETKESEIREVVGWRQTILRDRVGGTTKPLSLRDLRLRIENGGQIDLFDLGGCGCFVGSEELDTAAA
ncbi:hypothetical protein MCW82_07140 [Azospirillum doebereinerae]|uniref:hypothetical protein n=1 Tax=Azospirillum doebereinerae TaxID=92933 RepID=UPI001EE509C3|nr:hypothetical protein [Azospirillum doebereinerae]MCG5239542.1 hypothetical protein [Azospirillum doebereinerae]